MARFVAVLVVLLLVCVVDRAQAFKVVASFSAQGNPVVGPLKGSGPRFTIPGRADAIGLNPTAHLLYASSLHHNSDPQIVPDVEFAVFDLTTRTETMRFTIGTGYATDLVVLPSGAKAYATVDAGIVAIDLSTFTTTTISMAIPASGGLAVDASGAHVVASGGGTSNSIPFGRISVIDTATDTVSGFVDVTRGAGRIAIAPAGDRLYVNLYGDASVPSDVLPSDIAIFDVATLTQVGTVSPTLPAATPFVSSMAIHASGARLYAALTSVDPPAAGEVLGIDTADGIVKQLIPDVVVSTLVSDPRSKTLWAADSNAVRVYRMTCDVQTRRSIPVPGSIGDLAVRPCPTCRRFSPPCQ